ncbi:integrase core domain-containing protein [Hymenobacter canadensis]|uniref:integrase core domain-containing protein n=1 Tax=Hymenobacter canadensis TaxID=2999067 RepID=UPI0033132C43
MFDSDQGSQFTSQPFEQALLAVGCQISHDGRGRATDNAFIEHLWRSVKRECLYLNPAINSHYLYEQRQAYFPYYNYHRPHQAFIGPLPPNSSPKPLPSTHHKFA